MELPEEPLKKPLEEPLKEPLEEVWDSEKQKVFVLSSMKDPITQEFKPITDLAGVGKCTGEKLISLGFEYAYQLVGHYMVSSMDDEAIDHWLEEEAGIKRSELRATIINTMRKWCEHHL